MGIAPRRPSRRATRVLARRPNIDRHRGDAHASRRFNNATGDLAVGDQDLIKHAGPERVDAHGWATMMFREARAAVHSP